MSDSKQICEELLKLADIKINGNRSWDIQVHNNKVYSRILKKGSLGLGESYMDGWWDCESLDEFFNKILSANLNKKAKTHLGFSSKTKIAFNFLISKISNFQSISKSKRVAEEHYNLGNEFYEHMLDKEYMQYTCGYWKNAKNLHKQGEILQNELEMILRKILEKV